MHEVQNHLRRYLLQNFQRIIEINKEFINFTADDLFDVIADDTLNVQNEEIVWECCLRWIQYDEVNRIQFTQKLLQAIRLGLMDPNVIAI